MNGVEFADIITGDGLPDIISAKRRIWIPGTVGRARSLDRAVSFPTGVDNGYRLVT